MPPTQVLLYVPVLHAGYLRAIRELLDGHAGAQVVLLGESFRARYKPLAKDIRALNPDDVRACLRALGVVDVVVAQVDTLTAVLTAPALVVADEDVTRDVVTTNQLDAGRKITWVRTFLRWDASWSAAGRPVDYDGLVTADTYAQQLQRVAAGVAAHSSDWWRQVGALAVREGKIIATAYNEHRPSEYAPYTDGDPRANFSRGQRIDASTAIHAEAALIARAARDGVSLAGADLHVTTFPCPACAASVAEAGFARCYFSHGYSLVSGVEVLHAADVEIWWVEP